MASGPVPAVLILAPDFTLSRKPSSPCDSIRGGSGGRSTVVPVRPRDPTGKMRTAGPVRFPPPGTGFDECLSRRGTTEAHAQPSISPLATASSNRTRNGTSRVKA